MFHANTTTIEKAAVAVTNAPAPAAAPFFATVCPTILETEYSYGRDEEIFGEAEPREFIYQVVRGAVRTHKLLSDGRRQIDAFYLPGDVFGFDAGEAHLVTAEAVIDTRVKIIRRKSLESIASGDASVACTLWRMTAEGLRRAQEHKLLLGRKTALERVCAFLLEMTRRASHAGMVELPMSRRDIGDYLGLTLETVSRALSHLHEIHVLAFSGARNIVIQDSSRLAALAE